MTIDSAIMKGGRRLNQRGQVRDEAVKIGSSSASSDSICDSEMKTIFAEGRGRMNEERSEGSRRR
jgi:hypothetical protein